jgi:pyruvate dehydrogenase E1 component
MLSSSEDVFYYITVMNENYAQPAMPEGAQAGILQGHVPAAARRAGDKCRQRSRAAARAAGTILREVLAAAELLERDFGVAADVWSATSFNELRRDGIDVERWNRLHPLEQAPPFACRTVPGRPPRTGDRRLRLHAQLCRQIRPYVRGRYTVLGTDGFGRSDTRRALRSFFEVDRHHVAVAALKALADEGTLTVEKVAEAIERYGIDPDKPNPVSV